MTYRIHSTLHGANPCLEILDASSGSVRLAWEYPRQPAGGEASDPDLLAMERERAVHQLFCRLFLLTTEQYLKGGNCQRWHLESARSWQKAVTSGSL